jgi:alpha-1,6-mannosyltransferase
MGTACMNLIDRSPSKEPGLVAPARRDRSFALRLLLLGAAIVAELALLRSPRHSVASTAIVLAAALLVGALVALEHLAPNLGLGPVAAAVAIVIAASVVTPPRTSNDVWSYTMYGRIVTVHDTSPYDHVPADFRHDPFFHRLSPRWRRRGSVYGPVFVALAAADAWIAGPSALAARLVFQLVAALALAMVLLLLWRAARSVAALLFVGLNPVLAVFVVNGGHNDMLIGVLLLAAVMLVSRRRAGTAGALVGIATLIKLTAGLALIGLLLWAWRHELRRVAARVVGGAAAVVLAGYIPVAVSASHVLAGADTTVTNTSPWNGIVDRLLRHDAWRNVAKPLARNDTLTLFAYVGAATVLTLAIGIGWCAARRRRPDEAVGVSLAAYPVGAEYAYPWYAAWALPMFATDGVGPLGAVVWIQSIVMLAALKLPLAVNAGPADAVLRVVLTYVAPPCLLVAFVVVGLRQRNRATAPTVTGAASAIALEPGGGALSG